MAAKPLSPAIVELVMTDWRLGRLSQQDIATKHEISKGAVNKICKGISRDLTAIVTDGVQYRQGLQGHDDRIVTAVEKEVDQISGWLSWLHVALMRNAQNATKMQCHDQDDHLKLTRVLGETKTNIVGKNPETAIQVNNSVRGIVFTNAEDIRN